MTPKFSKYRIRLSPAGVHLFNRVTGQNVLVDEARVPEALWAHAPRNVSIALTNRCNLQCAFCYAPKFRATLDAFLVKQWLLRLHHAGCLGVGFGGGEPTLHPDFADLCSFTSGETGLAVTFTTHGHNVTASLAERLKGQVHFIRVSIDGVGRTYETVRGRTFDSLMPHLEHVHSIAPFGINVVINRTTINDLDEVLRLGIKFGASELLLLPELPVAGRGGVDSDTQTTLRTWAQAYRSDLRLGVAEHGMHGLPTCDALWRETGLRAYAHVDASGVLKESSYASTGVAIHGFEILASLAQLSERVSGGIQ